MSGRKPVVDPNPVVKPAPARQHLGKAEVSSGGRGKPLDEFVARLEAKHPGIEQETGLFSAALRAGRQVREMRLAKGWTQAQLAKQLGWDQVRISNIERGEGTLGPSFDVLQKIATACDYDIAFKPRDEFKPLGDEDLVRLREMVLGRLLGHGIPHSSLSSQQFADACIAFAGLLGPDVHFQMVEEAPAGAKSGAGEVGDIPYVEIATQGKRMVMLPLSVEDLDAESDAGADAVAMTMTYLAR